MHTQDALNEFLLSRQANGASPQTVRWYRAMLKKFGDRFPTLEVTTHDLRQYVVELRGELAAASVAGHVTALHAFWGWAAAEYQCPNPMKGVKRARSAHPAPKSADPKDFIKLLECASLRDAALLCFIADTGCRLGGAATLEVANLELDNNRAIVWEKGGRPRKVFFTTFTRQILRRWLTTRESDNARVFTSSTSGAPLTTSGIEQVFKRLKKRAGVHGRCNPHSFRHAFAREYVRSGGYVATLARLLGHEDIHTTAAYYAVFSEDELADMHQAHSPLRGMK